MNPRRSLDPPKTYYCVRVPFTVYRLRLHRSVRVRQTFIFFRQTLYASRSCAFLPAECRMHRMPAETSVERSSLEVWSAKGRAKQQGQRLRARRRERFRHAHRPGAQRGPNRARLGGGNGNTPCRSLHVVAFCISCVGKLGPGGIAGSALAELLGTGGTAGSALFSDSCGQAGY